LSDELKRALLIALAGLAWAAVRTRVQFGYNIWRSYETFFGHWFMGAITVSFLVGAAAVLTAAIQRRFYDVKPLETVRYDDALISCASAILIGAAFYALSASGLLELLV
jgi:hypothetical protein